MDESNGIFKRIANELLDLVYPPGLYCNCCGKITDDSRTYGLCNECMGNIRWNTSRACIKCGKALTDTDPGETCFWCRQHPHSFDRGYACAEYGMHEKTLIYEMKYASRGDIALTIGEIVYDRMAAELGKDVLRDSYDMAVPIPIYRKRKNTRGFNQAALIAKEFSKRSGIPMDEDILYRAKATSPMKGLGPAERRANISGAFALRNHRADAVSGKSILLIDDIYTTGVTIDEAATVLKAAGASRVDFVAFASGADMLLA